MDILTINDKPGEHAKGSYYAASCGPTPDHPELEDDIECDVCIVGAGFAGLSAALHLADAGLDVVLLEANRVGWGASGRNGGQIHTGQRQDQKELIKLMGETDAANLWQLSLDAVDLIKSLVAENDIQCDLKPGLLLADIRKSETSYSKEYAEFLKAAYDFNHVTYLDESEIRDHVKTNAYHGGLLYDVGGHLHPLKFALGLENVCRKRNVRIHEKTRVSGFENVLQKTLTKTPKGSVTSKYLVFTLNGYHNDLVRENTRHVMPINNFIIATEPLGEGRARELIKNDCAIADSNFIVNYYRFSADHRLLFGGGENYRYKFPETMQETARGRMLSIFQGLDDVGIDYCWGGTLGITLNRLPYFFKKDGQILSTGGFSGQGVALSTFSGKLIAEAIIENPQSFDLMEKLPSYPFPGGALLRWPIMALAMVFANIRDRF